MTEPKSLPLPAERGLAEVAEVASFLRIAPRSARRLIDRGEILSVKVGGRRLVPVAAVERYLARIEREAEGSPDAA